MNNPQFNIIVFLFIVLICAILPVGCMARINQNKLQFRLENKGKLITLHSGESESVNEIRKALVQILYEADGRYFLLLTKKHIKGIKNDAHVEFVFSDSEKEPPISPFGGAKVRKLLLSLAHDKYGWEKNGSCNIIFGTPEYDEVNIVYNSNPHINDNELIKMLKKISN